jgi:hypothetical protein
MSPFEIGIASFWRARNAGEIESHAIERAISDALDAAAAEQECPDCGKHQCQTNH